MLFWMEFAVIICCLVLGARLSGVAMGLAGGLGLTILTFVFHLKPSSPPIDVLLIIAAVTTLAATLQAAGGLDYLVGVAERMLRKNPNRITFMGPIVACLFTFFTGTAYVALAVFPVIAEVAYEARVRVERPLSISVVAASMGITGSPVSAATAALVGILAVQGITLGSIMLVCIPAVFVACLAGAFAVYKKGKELADDPEFQARLASGEITPPPPLNSRRTYPTSAKLAVGLFAVAVGSIVVLGTFKGLLPAWEIKGKLVTLSIPHAIEMIAMAASVIMVLCCKVKARSIVESTVFVSGMTGVMAIFGIAWMTDTFFLEHKEVLVAALSTLVQAHPWLFAVALFFMSALLFSQGATVRSLMPVGLALGIPAPYLVAMFPAANATFFFPATGTIVGAMAFDRSGTTRIGKYVLNHSFMLPGVVSIVVAVVLAFGLVFLGL